MGLWNGIKRIFTWWSGQTYGTQRWTWRKGVKVGEDAQGNVFYTTADNSRRWVIYNGEAEASRISPEWHGWLHQTYQTPPGKTVAPVLLAIFTPVLLFVILFVFGLAFS